MQHLEFSWIYPVHSVAVFQMATRLDHLDEKARYLGYQRHAVRELRERDGIFRSVTQRQVDAELPRWAFRFFKHRNMITQTQLWEPASYDGTRRYDALVEFSGVPVAINGEGRLTPVDITSTRYEIHLDVSSAAPIVGFKIVKVVSAALQRAIDGEHEFRMIWLGRQDLIR